MSRRLLIVLMAAAALPVLMAGPKALAQSDYPPIGHPNAALPQHARRRITINPAPLLYRRCTDWYELQNRPSGTVLYPQIRCWWVRG
jgi:hypothetical protein